mgnify:CR=1 FL=1|jgi:hypothetical protein
MFYQALNSKIECFDKCIKATEIFLLSSTTVFTILTFVYLKEMTDVLRNVDFNSIEDTFDDLKECITKSGICS